MTWRAPLLVAAAAAVPRLAVLSVERGDVLAAFTEKSDDFARTFVETGTYGFVPDIPSAYTQPLYGFFLVPVYAIERAWWSVGLAQTLAAVVTALIGASVYAWLVYGATFLVRLRSARRYADERFEMDMQIRRERRGLRFWRQVLDVPGQAPEEL